MTTDTVTGNLSTLMTGIDGTATYGFNVTDGSNATLVGGGNVTSRGQNVVLDVQGNTLWGFVNVGGAAGQYNVGVDRAVFRVDLNTATGVFIFTLLDSIDHHAIASADNVEGIKAIDLSGKLTVSDSADGGSLAFGNISVNVIDDIPTIGAFKGATIANEIGSVNGTFAVSPGADDLHHFNITGPAIAGITYSTTTTTNGSGLTTTLLTASADPDGAGGNSPVTVYTLAVREDGTYAFNLVTPEASVKTSISLGGITAGGPDDFVELSGGLVELHALGGGDINASTQGFGIKNNLINQAARASARSSTRSLRREISRPIRTRPSRTLSISPLQALAA